MEVILLEKMRNLGALGDKVKVKSGFARNYLVPQGKAVYATKDNMVKFEARRAELEKAAAAKYQEIVAKQERLNKMAPITIAAKAGEEGKLFGSVGTRDIADAITKAGEHVEKSEIRLSEGALRFLGEFEIVVELDNDLTATVKLNITPEA